MKIPAPTAGHLGMTEADVARWHANQAILAADPRTAGGANRPPALVERVLREAAENLAAAAAPALPKETDLLERASAIRVIGRSSLDNFAVRLKNDLIAQARVEHAREIAALRAEVEVLRAKVAA